MKRRQGGALLWGVLLLSWDSLGCFDKETRAKCFDIFFPPLLALPVV